VLAYALIVVGGIMLARRLRIQSIWMSFWLVFAALIGVLALTGHSMVARWHVGPIGGLDYWRTLALSPETLIFAYFMITDPRTSAHGRTGRVLYGAAVGAMSAFLISFQTTEYASKVSLLTGLVLVCALRPLLERWSRASSDDPAPRTWLAGSRHRLTSVGVALVATFGVLVGSSIAGPAPTVAAAAAGSRPHVVLTAEQRPRVEVTAAARAVAGGTQAAGGADGLARGTIQALLLSDRAVAEGDRELMAEVASGPWLQSLRGAARAAAPKRTVRTAKLDVVRDPTDFQSVPTVAVTLTGTQDDAPWTATFQVATVGDDVVIVRRRPAG
jgi:hypothetical protein